MSKTVFAMVLGAVLGALDGMSAYVSEPEVRPVILSIVAGSTFRKIMLPGGLVGLLVGYATYRHADPRRPGPA